MKKMLIILLTVIIFGSGIYIGFFVKKPLYNLFEQQPITKNILNKEEFKQIEEQPNNEEKKDGSVLDNVLDISWNEMKNGKFPEGEVRDEMLNFALSLNMEGFSEELKTSYQISFHEKMRNVYSLLPYELKEFLDASEEELGMIKTGEYKDYKLVRFNWTNDFGMGGSKISILFLQKKNLPIIGLTNYGYTKFMSVAEDSWSVLFNKNLVVSAFETRDDLVISEFSFPEILFDENGNTFKVEGRYKDIDVSKDKIVEMKASGKTNPISVFNHMNFSENPDDFMINADLLLQRKDGIFIGYEYQFPFKLEDSTVVSYPDGFGASIKKYGYKHSFGCGQGATDVVELKKEDLLSDKIRIVGKIVDGEKTFPIYANEWTVEEMQKEDTEANKYYQYYQQRLSWTIQDKKDFQYSMESFLKTHPIFYFQDSFGRWIRFTQESAQEAAECGKPLIYLYPEKETTLEVKLEPKGGFTYTEPEYKNGWRILAKPDGELVNLDDGKKYPYLFWEGRGKNYVFPEKYWVVKKEDVKTFLHETLGKIGFNEKEIVDFKEFWVPKMQKSKFYKIGFHGTNIMDEIAPLFISQKPDSILRVLMDYEELEKEEPSNPPKYLSPFIRKGFVVAEWGGVLGR